MKTSVIEVSGMLSALSASGVEKELGKLRGVASVTVNYAAGSATVRYDETRLTIADIKAKVYKCGYQSGGESKPKHVGVHKPAGKHIARAHRDAPHAHNGHTDQSAAAGAASAAIPAPSVAPVPEAPPVAAPKADAAPGPPPAVVPAVVLAPGPEPLPAALSAPAGHQGHAPPGGQPAMSADMAQEMGHGGNMDLPAMVRDMRNRFWICLVFAVPIFIYSPMGNLFPAPDPPFNVPLNQWLFGLASAAILYPSWPFFVAAWRALKTGTLNMAVLIVLSVGTGYLFSVGATFLFESEQFFEASAVLMVFILLGHWLEMRARAGASSAIKALMDLTPAKASVLRGGTEIEVATAEVVVGDIVVIRPGNKIPVDGTIESGDSLVDESMLLK